MKTYTVELTSDELFEIERWADQAACNLLGAVKEVVIPLQSIKGSDELRQKLFNTWCKDYDMYRTLSAKCEKQRKGE